MIENILPNRTAQELVTSRKMDMRTEAMDVAREIVADVQTRGIDALRSYAARFDGLGASDRLFYHRADIDEAWRRVGADDRSRLERIGERIGRFAGAQRQALMDISIDVQGGTVGHTVRPVQRAGCYAPAGTYPLPSSILMTAVTAKVAGVQEIWVASPSPSPMMLAAAFIGGANGLLAAGGAQAIAALAYGVELLPPCDVVVGPGNRYVTAAKRLVAADVAIDMVAGPSELVVIADESADASLVAADLLSQAEHDIDAWPVLLTTSPTLVENVRQQLWSQLKNLKTASVAREAIAHGGACVLSTIQDSISLCEALAPEHVQVCTNESAHVARSLTNYGALFIGAQSPAVLGDYGIGPNHVLPTSGVAKSRGGLSVLTFLRVNTWVEASLATDDTLRDDVLWLARVEGLEAHARAIEGRGVCPR